MSPGPMRRHRTKPYSRDPSYLISRRYDGGHARPRRALRRPRRVRDPRGPRRRRARRDDRRRLAADLPDLDLRPGRRRPAARAATSTPAARTRPASASSARWRTSRAGATGSRSRAARRRPRRSPSSPARATRSSSATTSTAARTATSSASTGPRAAGRASYVDLASGHDALWEGLTARTRLVWFESPSNPLLKVTDIAAAAATRPRPRGAGGAGAAARRRRQHVRVAGAPAPARARRRHRVPLGHQVPRRALGRDPRDRGHVERRRRRAAAVPPERDGRRARAVRLLPGPARAAHARPADGAPLRERDWPSPGSSPAATTSPGSAIRAWPRVPTRIPAHATAARQMRLGDAPAFGGMVSFMLAAGGHGGRTRGRARRRGLRVGPAVHPRRVARRASSR